MPVQINAIEIHPKVNDAILISIRRRRVDNKSCGGPTPRLRALGGDERCLAFLHLAGTKKFQKTQNVGSGCVLVEQKKVKKMSWKILSFSY